MIQAQTISLSTFWRCQSGTWESTASAFHSNHHYRAFHSHSHPCKTMGSESGGSHIPRQHLLVLCAGLMLLYRLMGPCIGKEWASKRGSSLSCKLPCPGKAIQLYFDHTPTSGCCQLQKVSRQLC